MKIRGINILSIIRCPSPIALLSLGYLMIILIGALMLSCPVSSQTGVYTPIIDTLFTAASAVTTTGLGVVDTGTHFSLFGQLVITLMIQIGGLGYMLFVVIAFMTFQKRISFQSNLMLQESVKKPRGLDIFHFVKIIIILTAVIEIAGAIVLALLFSQYYPVSDSIYSGIFHSISTFNTAGFSIYPDSFSRFVNNTPVNMVLIILSTLGSLGFFVLYDAGKILVARAAGIRNRGLSVHSRLVLICTLLMVLISFILFYFSEYAGRGFSVKYSILASLFQVSSAATTTGFNSIDIGSMKDSSLLLTVVLMFVGAGSGGTGGGIKITTFAVLLLSVSAILNNRANVTVYKRRITFEVIRNSFAIATLALLWVVIAAYVMTLTENRQFLHILFEVTSAIGTVGLSAGITPGLSAIGKITIILTMIIGRIGPLGIGLSLFNSTRDKSYKYSTADIFIG